MAITFDRVKELLKGEGLKFYIDPDRPVARLALAGASTRLEMAVALNDEGRFLQLRTIGFHACASDHQHCGAVLRVLAEINYLRRFVKFGWDPDDGEVVAYGDLWIMDAQVSQEQFHRMMSNFVPSIDQAHPRIAAVLQTGKDPGDDGVLKALQAASGPGGGGGAPGGMPPALKQVLDRLAKRAGEGGDGAKKAGGGESVTTV